jgi:hypothetical protein
MLSHGWEHIWTWLETHQTVLGWLGLLSLLTFFGTLLIVPVLVVRLPQDYLHADKKAVRNPYGSWWWPIQILKNLFGIALVLAGLAMLVLPGQGLLTIFIGLSLVNFPGKPRLLRKMVRQKRIMHSINWLRQKFDHPPLDPVDRV